MKHRLLFVTIFLGVFLCGALLSSCSNSTSKETTIQVFAANSLQKALDEAQTLYEEENPHITFADTQYEGSGTLVQMMNGGAHADIFIPASLEHANSALASDLVEKDSIEPLFKNNLVVVASAQSPFATLTFSEVVSGNYSLAVGDDNVPAGTYAKQALYHVGLYSSASGKGGTFAEAIADKTIQGSSVGNVCRYAESGEIDLAFVYNSDAKRFENVKIVCVVPEEMHEEILYPVALTCSDQTQGEAAKFIEWATTSEEAKTIWNKWGFELYSTNSSSNVASSTESTLSPATKSEDDSSFLTWLSSIDLSPLWVTLKTTGAALVLIFTLGLLTAWLSMRLSPRAQNILDAILTVPMVLPPTVCGFLLLLLLGSNTPLGQWFDTVGFPLVFSWQATVIAASVVSFPLMYRSARGAFENIDPSMLDAARTLGWSESKILVRLMLPLSWSSIAAGTMLAYARALGEFGATLFLAGNYAGITRTIPIAIYFEWMGGNVDVALFWTVVVIAISFVMILLINILSSHTTRYRNTSSDERRN